MKVESVISKSANRRSFLKKGALAAGAATVGAGLLGQSFQSSDGKKRAAAFQPETPQFSDSSLPLKLSRPTSGYNTQNWEESRTVKFRASRLAGICSTSPLLNSSMRTWRSMFTTTRMMNLHTGTFSTPTWHRRVRIRLTSAPLQQFWVAPQQDQAARSGSLT